MERNPAFYIELERIKANLTDCVMPIHPFKEITKYRSLVLENPKLAKRFAEADVRRAEDYARLAEMGLDVVVSPTILSRVLTFEISPDLIVYVCRSNKKRSIEKRLEKLASLEVKALRKGSIDDRLKISEIEGSLLGYPKCCVSKFVELKRNSFFGRSSPPETVTILECLELGFFNVLKLFSNPPKELSQEFFAFFTSNFYPCSVNCSKAISIGMRIYEQLDAKKRKIYRCKLILNVLNVLVSAYNSYRFVKERGAKTEFGKAVLRFFEKLSSDELSRLEKISKLMAVDSLDFENGYISMYLD